MSPYTLPEGNVQIAFSGGRTSAFMLHAIAEANGGLPDRVEVVFTNTSKERPESLDFVAEVERQFGLPIVRAEYRPDAPRFAVVSHDEMARKGEVFEALVRKERYLPNVRARICTKHLKVLTAHRYLKSIGWKHWTVARGIRADEPRANRKPRVTKRPTPDTIWQPLVTAGITQADVLAFWARMPFDLAIPPGDLIGGNCDGCFLKSERAQVAVAGRLPQCHSWWERMEALGATVFKSPDKARFSNRYSKASLRRFAEGQGDWILSDEAGLCQANEGECAA